MTDSDLRALDDGQLDQLRRKVAIEQERRANLEAIPDQMRQLADTYRDGGGDPDTLLAAVTGDTTT